MASAVCHMGLLNMRPLQLYLKAQSLEMGQHAHRGHSQVCQRSEAVVRSRHIQPWMITMDTSTQGWGAVCEGMPV